MIELMSYKKFYDSHLIKIYPLFSQPPMRDYTSLIMIFSIIQYFKYQNILEIGFFEGLTFAAMLEATEPGANLTAIDVEFRRTMFDQHYANSEFSANKTVRMLTMQSQDYVPDQIYDFINVDSGARRDLDIAVASKCISPAGVIMLDDYQQHEQAVESFLKLNTGFVPFLADSKALYFHHQSHSADDFLDEFVESKFSSFCSTNNKLYKNYWVKTVEPRLFDITSLDSAFRAFANTYNI